MISDVEGTSIFLQNTDTCFFIVHLQSTSIFDNPHCKTKSVIDFTYDHDTFVQYCEKIHDNEYIENSTPDNIDKYRYLTPENDYSWSKWTFPTAMYQSFLFPSDAQVQLPLDRVSVSETFHTCDNSYFYEMKNIWMSCVRASLHWARRYLHVKFVHEYFVEDVVTRQVNTLDQRVDPSRTQQLQHIKDSLSTSICSFFLAESLDNHAYDTVEVQVDLLFLRCPYVVTNSVADVVEEVTTASFIVLSVTSSLDLFSRHPSLSSALTGSFLPVYMTSVKRTLSFSFAVRTDLSRSPLW